MKPNLRLILYITLIGAEIIIGLRPFSIPNVGKNQEEHKRYLFVEPNHVLWQTYVTFLAKLIDLSQQAYTKVSAYEFTISTKRSLPKNSLNFPHNDQCVNIVISHENPLTNYPSPRVHLLLMN